MCVCPTVKPTSVATLFVQDAGDIPFGDKVGHSPWVPAEVAGPPDGTVLVVLHCTSHAMPSRGLLLLLGVVGGGARAWERKQQCR